MKFLIPLLLVSQFMIFPNLSFRWAKEVSVQVLILFGICSLIWTKNKAIALFVGWNIALFFIFKSLVINDYVPSPEYKVNLLAFFNIINIVLYGVFYYILHQIKLDRKLIFKVFGFIAVFQSGYVIIQFLQLDQFFNNITYSLMGQYKCWPVGLWGNEALVSWCIAICSPYLLAFDKFRFKAGYGLCGIAILCTKVSASIAAFALGFIFWLFFKNKKAAVILLICVLLIGCWAYFSGQFTYYFNPTHRFEVWKKSIEIYKTRPITGQGLGAYRVMFWKLAPEFRSDGHWAQAHNTYIQTLFESGIIGLGLLLSILFIAFRRFIENRKVIPATSLLITSMIMFWGFPFHTAIGILPLVGLVLLEKE